MRESSQAVEDNNFGMLNMKVSIWGAATGHASEKMIRMEICKRGERTGGFIIAEKEDGNGCCLAWAVTARIAPSGLRATRSSWGNDTVAAASAPTHR